MTAADEAAVPRDWTAAAHHALDQLRTEGSEHNGVSIAGASTGTAARVRGGYRTVPSFTVPGWMVGKPKDEHDAALLRAEGFLPIPGWPPKPDGVLGWGPRNRAAHTAGQVQR